VSEARGTFCPAPFDPDSQAGPPLSAIEDSSPEDLRIVEIVPRAIVPRAIVPGARIGAPRLVGPGRRERAYLERVAALERELARIDAQRTELEDRERRLAVELEMVSLLERGSERRLNRAERTLSETQAEIRLREQREHRLILALGALQNENQRLSRKLESLRAADRPALGPRRETQERGRRGWRALVRRWLGA
jgi:hypothetical protein